MLTWELKEKYELQGDTTKAVSEKYQQAVIKAGTDLEDRKAELESHIREEVKTGKPDEARKMKLRATIADAERAYAAVIDEQRIAREATEHNGKISVHDLVFDWNGPYREKIRAEKLAPIQKRIADARREYLTALLDWLSLRDEYKYERESLADMARRSRVGQAVHEVTVLDDITRITDDDLFRVEEYRRLPIDLQDGAEA